MWQEGSEPGSTSSAVSSGQPGTLPGSPLSRQRHDQGPGPRASFGLTLAHVREIAGGRGLWNCCQQASGLSVRTEQQEGAIRLLLTGDLDQASAPLAERCVARAQEEYDSVMVDLEGLSFMDSSGIDIFLHAAKRARNTGGRIQVVNTHKHRRVFTLCRATFLLEGQGIRTGSVADQPSKAF